MSLQFITLFLCLPGHGLSVETLLGRVNITDSTMQYNLGNGLKAKFVDGWFPVIDESLTFCNLVNLPGAESYPQLITGITMLGTLSPCGKVAYYWVYMLGTLSPCGKVAYY